MLLPALAASLLATQPTDFHAACGFEPGVRYEFRMHQLRKGGEDITLDSAGRLILEMKRQADSPTILLVTLDINDQMTPKQASTLGLTLDDFRTTAEFLLDEEYNLVELRNWELLRDKGNKIATKLTDARVKAGLVEPEQAELAKSMVTDLSSTHDGVFFMYSKRVAPYFLGYGWVLPQDEPITYETALPNPYGGEPLPASITIQLNDDPETPDLIEFQHTQSLDQEKAAALLLDFFQRLDAPGEEDFREAVRQLQITDTVTWAYDPEAQLIRSATYERHMQIPDQPLAIERWTWELVGQHGPEDTP